MSKTVKIAVWVAFSVGFALLPLFINFLMLRIEGKRLDWHDLSSHGELVSGGRCDIRGRIRPVVDEWPSIQLEGEPVLHRLLVRASVFFRGVQSRRVKAAGECCL
jgi:hypothetical protein